MAQQFQTIEADGPRNRPETRKKSAGHVLVVDDERLLRWAVAETLTARGYEVSEAGDAKSALAVLVDLERSTNLVLLDLFLPDATDLRVLQQIRTCAPAIPVVLMTAFATPEIVEQALAAGALFMPKPFDMDSLSALIERTMPSPPS